MVRPLAALGLAAALERVAERLEAAWQFRRWEDGRVLFVQTRGQACHALYGAHCYTAHRGDLLALPADGVQRGQRLVSAEPAGDAMSLQFTHRNGRRSDAEADVVVGADGIHSVLRERMAPQAEARFSGLCAFRCLVPAARAPAMALPPVQTLWQGPGRHLVHYAGHGPARCS